MPVRFLLIFFVFISSFVGAQTITVYFDFNSFLLNNETRQTLNQFIAKRQIKSIGFFGHTDQMGSVEYNDWLSVQRALAVKDYFLSRGIKEVEISVVRGFGADRLISDQTDSLSRQLNRRVSITTGYKPTPTDLAAVAKQTPTYYTPSPNLVKDPVVVTNTVAEVKPSGQNNTATKVDEPRDKVENKVAIEPAKKQVVVEPNIKQDANQSTEVSKEKSIAEEGSFASKLSKTINKSASSAAANNNTSSAASTGGPVVKQQKNEKLIEDIKDNTTREGEHIVLKNIYFSGGRHSFLAKSYSALDDLLETMQKVPTLVVEIQGHVCCHEGDGDEIDFDSGRPVLSVTRAKAVYDFLIENGIDKKRITYKGLAHKFPLIKIEKSEEDAEANRRVEIKIIKK